MICAIFEIEGIPYDYYHLSLPSGWELFTNDARSVMIDKDELDENEMKNFVTGYSAGYFRHEYGNPNKISAYVIAELFANNKDAKVRARQIANEETRSEEGGHEYYPAIFFMQKVM